MSNKAVNRGKNKQASSTSRNLIVPVLAIAGCLTTILPNPAIAASYSNDYSVCTGRLLKVGITAEAASQGCAAALRPRDLAACVVKIDKQNGKLKINNKPPIPVVDALSSCGKARRPQELAKCVVDYVRPNLQVDVNDQNLDTEEKINQATLDSCGRSLLPERFGLCVKGLEEATGLASKPLPTTVAGDYPKNQSLYACIDGSDSSVIGGSSSSTPPTTIPAGSSPSPETLPFPTQPTVPAQPRTN